MSEASYPMQHVSAPQDRRRFQSISRPSQSTFQSVKRFLKSNAIRLASGLPSDSYVGRTYGGRGIIVVLHEVTPDPAANLGIGIRPGDLRKSLAWLRSAGFDFVTLDEALRRLGDPASPKFAVLTFDDGYRNNVIHALPVLEEFSAPFVIYMPTSVLTREIDAWWCGLRRLFLQHHVIDIEPMETRFTDLRDIDAKTAAFDQCMAWVWQDFSRASELKTTFARYGISMRKVVDREFIGEMEFRQLANHPLVTIGAHSITHWPLASLSDNDIWLEMAGNRTFLEALLQKTVDHFAYPFGRPAIDGEREARIARMVGFKSAVTTDTGSLFPEHADHPHLLPRIHMEYRVNAFSSFVCATNGLFRAVETRFGKPAANVA